MINHKKIINTYYGIAFATTFLGLVLAVSPFIQGLNFKNTANNLGTVIESSTKNSLPDWTDYGGGLVMDFATGSTTERYSLNDDGTVFDILTGSSTPRYISNNNGTFLDTFTMKNVDCGKTGTIGESNQSSSTKIWSCAQVNTGWASATSFCTNLSENGTSWKLPPASELVLAYEDNVSNFANDYYWTDANDGSLKAKYVDMTNGNNGSNFRTMVYHVRCIK